MQRMTNETVLVEIRNLQSLRRNISCDCDLSIQKAAKRTTAVANKLAPRALAESDSDSLKLENDTVEGPNCTSAVSVSVLNPN